MKFLILASLFVLSVFAEPEAEADAQWYNWNRGYGYYPMSYGYNRWNSYNNYNSFNRYNWYNRNFFGQRRFVREAEAEAEADAQYYNQRTSGYVKYSNGAIVPEETDDVKLAKAQHQQAHNERRENEQDNYSEEDRQFVYANVEAVEARPLRHYVQLFKNMEYPTAFGLKAPEDVNQKFQVQIPVTTYTVNPNPMTYTNKVQVQTPVQTYTVNPTTYTNKVQVQTPAVQTYAMNPYYHVYQPRVYAPSVVYKNEGNGKFYYAYSSGNTQTVAQNAQKRFVREADAEAEPEAEAQWYNWNRGYGYYPYSMNYGYSGYPYNRYNNYMSYNRYNNYNRYNMYNRYNSFNGYYHY